MIYIFSALGGVCQAYRWTCKASCEAVVYLCKEVVGALKACCAGFGGISQVLCDTITIVLNLVLAVIAVVGAIFQSLFDFQGPLGSFVVLALLLNVPAGFKAVTAIGDPQVGSCPGLPQFCKVTAGLALAHVAFAMYLKYQLNKAPEAAEATGFPDAAPPARPKGTQEVVARMRDIAYRDVGFCLYIFVFAFSFYHNSLGFATINACDIASWSSSNAALLEIFYGVLAIVYGTCWSCFNGCVGLVEPVWRRASRPPLVGTPPITGYHYQPLPGSARA